MSEVTITSGSQTTLHLVETIPDRDWIAVTSAALSSDELTAWATRPACGAVVTFCGTVRHTSGAHDDVVALEYETSVTLAERALGDIVAATRQYWPEVEAIAVHHRIGEVALGDVAVVVAVSSAHRHDAFEAARFCIDTLKECVPMWKREVWPGGGAWSSDTRPLQRVIAVAAARFGERDAAAGVSS